MPFEIKDWKKLDCSLNLEIAALSDRERFSREINDTFGEGGGLNANYQTVEAIAVVANMLGTTHGLVYGVDFIFKTGGLNQISFDFRNKEVRDLAGRAFH